MLPIHCPSSIAGLSITALQCLNLLSAANEVSSPTPYSKFGPQTSSATALPSRSAMLLIYAPAAVTSAAFFGVAPATNGREALVAAMLFAHFGKRVLEVLFVHVYSGAADGRISAFIGTFYALVAALICKMQATVPASLYAAPAATTVLPAALALFVVGQAGNLYHHRLLAKLRTNSKSTLSTQVPPTSTTPSAMQEVPASKKQSACMWRFQTQTCARFRCCVASPCSSLRARPPHRTRPPNPPRLTAAYGHAVDTLTSEQMCCRSAASSTTARCHTTSSRSLRGRASR